MILAGNPSNTANNPQRPTLLRMNSINYGRQSPQINKDESVTSINNSNSHRLSGKLGALPRSSFRRRSRSYGQKPSPVETLATRPKPPTVEMTEM